MTPAPAHITVTSPAGTRTAELYSEAGLDLVAGLWLELSAQFRLMYDLTWLGIPVIQLPGDIVMMQELVWRLRPDVIVECGVAHGGSAILYASILELAGKGFVLGVDVEIRPYNRLAIESHPLAHRIRLVEGSSIAAETVKQVEEACAGARTVLVVLDSNHSEAHVTAELEAYHRLVTPGSYAVVMDGAQALVASIPAAKPEWGASHPLAAIEKFLAAHPEFAEDPRYTRTRVTSNPRGFLRRKPLGELR